MPRPTLIELRNAARALMRPPTVSLSAIVCLALGIGSTAAISSAVSRALLQPLPFRDADRLVAVHRTTPTSGPQGTWPQSVPNYLDLAAATRQVDGLSAISQGTALVQLTTGAIQASQLFVTGGFFPTLSTTAQRGRLLAADDAKAESPLVAVLSDEFWRTKLGGDPAIVGHQINIDGMPTTVVGLLPPEFRVPLAGNIFHADVWMSLRFTPQQLTQRRSNYLLLIGRLAPNVVSDIRNFGPVLAPQPEMYWTYRQGSPGSSRFPLMIRTKSDDPTAVVNAVRAAIRSVDPTAAISTVRTMPEVINRSLGQPRFYFSLLGTFAAVAMLLAVAGLYGMLSYVVAQRTREIGIRPALGSPQKRLIRLIMMEGFNLVIAGLVFGFIGGAAMTRLMTFMHYGVSPLDVTTWASAAMLLVVAALLATLIPAYRAARVDPLIAIRVE